MTEPWDSQMQALGDFIRRQRKQANLSLRQLAERTRLSNPYLSQIERGLHQPSMRVIKLISEALNVSAETLLTHAGLLHSDRHGDQSGHWPGGLLRYPGSTAGSPADERPAVSTVADAISAESRLSEQQKAALISVYESMLHPD
jgi:transcriptional regulator with XRE-family HTH domain